MISYNDSLDALRTLCDMLEAIAGDDAETIEKEIIQPLESAFSQIYEPDEDGVEVFAMQVDNCLKSLYQPQQ